MRIKVLSVLLLAAQIYLTFKGAHHFSKYWSPVILFAVSAGIAVIYFREYLRRPAANAAQATGNQRTALTWLWALAGMLTMVLAYEELRKLFVQFPDPGKLSDVLPQLETLYQRFSRGEFPYTPIPMENNTPYPVYMPLHWLPIGLGYALGVGARWLGYGLLVLATGIYGAWVGRQAVSAGARIAALFLPSLGLWGFILWGNLELPVSLETVIAAYYLVLAVGLAGRNMGLITLGLILCLLSRYTLIFWLPLFAYVLWQEKPLRTSLQTWGSVALSIVLIYIVPFLLKDPSIFSKGITYHNGCAAAEWTGYGENPVSWTMERGIYFAIYMKTWFTGDMEHRVFLARAIQAAVMLGLLGFGIWAFHRWRARMDGFALSLVMLYAVIACFYFFSPMTFQYYFLVLFVLSAVVTAKVLLLPQAAKH